MRYIFAFISMAIVLSTSAQQVLLYGSDKPFSSLERDSVLTQGRLFQKLHYKDGRLIFRSGYNEDSVEVTETFVYSGELLTHCEIMVSATGETLKYRHVLESGRPILGIRDEGSKAIAPIKVSYEYDEQGMLRTEERIFLADSMNTIFRYHHPEKGHVQVTRLNANKEPVWVEDRMMDDNERVKAIQRRKVGEKEPFLYVVVLKED